MADDPVALYDTLEKGLAGIFPGVRMIAVSSGKHSHPPDPGMIWLVDRMYSMKASELLIEEDIARTLIVRHDYGDSAAAVSYRDGISPVDLSRFVRHMLSGRDQRVNTKPYVPAADIERLSRCWKKRIAYIFGEKFASRLVEKSFAGKSRDTITPDELDATRAFISSALGDCLFLDKVNK